MLSVRLFGSARLGNSVLSRGAIKRWSPLTKPVRQFALTRASPATMERVPVVVKLKDTSGLDVYSSRVLATALRVETPRFVGNRRAIGAPGWYLHAESVMPKIHVPKWLRDICQSDDVDLALAAMAMVNETHWNTPNAQNRNISQEESHTSEDVGTDSATDDIYDDHPESKMDVGKNIDKWIEERGGASSSGVTPQSLERVSEAIAAMGIAFRSKPNLMYVPSEQRVAELAAAKSTLTIRDFERVAYACSVYSKSSSVPFILLQRLRQVKLEPTSLFFAHLTRLALRVDDLSGALRLVQLMPELKTECNELTAYSLAVYCCKHGDSTNAVVAIRYLVKAGYSKRISLFTKMIAGMAYYSHPYAALRVFRAAESIKIPLFTTTFNALLFAFRAQGDVEGAMLLYEEMLEHGFVPTDRTFAILIETVAEAARRKLPTALPSVQDRNAMTFGFRGRLLGPPAAPALPDRSSGADGSSEVPKPIKSESLVHGKVIPSSEGALATDGDKTSEAVAFPDWLQKPLRSELFHLAMQKQSQKGAVGAALVLGEGDVHVARARAIYSELTNLAGVTPGYESDLSLLQLYFAQKRFDLALPFADHITSQRRDEPHQYQHIYSRVMIHLASNHHSKLCDALLSSYQQGDPAIGRPPMKPTADMYKWAIVSHLGGSGPLSARNRYVWKLVREMKQAGYAVPLKVYQSVAARYAKTGISKHIIWLLQRMVHHADNPTYPDAQIFGSLIKVFLMEGNPKKATRALQWMHAEPFHIFPNAQHFAVILRYYFLNHTPLPQLPAEAAYVYVPTNQFVGDISDIPDVHIPSSDEIRSKLTPLLYSDVVDLFNTVVRQVTKHGATVCNIHPQTLSLATGADHFSTVCDSEVLCLFARAFGARDDVTRLGELLQFAQSFFPRFVTIELYQCIYEALLAKGHVLEAYRVYDVMTAAISFTRELSVYNRDVIDSQLDAQDSTALDSYNASSPIVSPRRRMELVDEKVRLNRLAKAKVRRAFNNLKKMLQRGYRFETEPVPIRIARELKGEHFEHFLRALLRGSEWDDVKAILDQRTFELDMLLCDRIIQAYRPLDSFVSDAVSDYAQTHGLADPTTVPQEGAEAFEQVLPVNPDIDEKFVSTLMSEMNQLLQSNPDKALKLVMSKLDAKARKDKLRPSDTTTSNNTATKSASSDTSKQTFEAAVQDADAEEAGEARHEAAGAGSAADSSKATKTEPLQIVGTDPSAMQRVFAVIRATHKISATPVKPQEPYMYLKRTPSSAYFKGKQDPVAEKARQGKFKGTARKDSTSASDGKHTNSSTNHNNNNNNNMKKAASPNSNSKTSSGPAQGSSSNQQASRPNSDKTSKSQ